MIAGAFSSTSGKADTVLTTSGDVLYYTSSRQRLAIGDEGQVLTVSGSDLPAWETATGVTASSTTTFTNKTYTNLKMKTAVELTISSGSVVRTQIWHTIDTEGDASTDDLTNATGGATGELLYLESVNSGRDVTIKDSSGGAGAFRTAGDFTLAQTLDTFTCMNYAIADEWLEISRSTN